MFKGFLSTLSENNLSTDGHEAGRAKLKGQKLPHGAELPDATMSILIDVTRERRRCEEAARGLRPSSDNKTEPSDDYLINSNPGESK